MNKPDMIVAAEHNIAQGRATTGRSCGTCSLCCRLLDVPEIGKPKNDWCQHCRPGHGGCSIYDQRPAVCRGYACLWLVNEMFDDAWFPAKARIVADLHYSSPTERTILRFHVDPRFPNRWREEPYYSKIKQLALLGLQGKINEEMIQTIISIKGEWTIILPHRELKYQPGVTVRTGDDSFEYIPCKSDNDARKLLDKLKALQDTIQKARADNPGLAHNPIALLEIAVKELMVKEN